MCSSDLIIKTPMDLKTMSDLVESKVHHSYAWIRECFDLMVYNALTFNRSYSSLWNEARRYHDSCVRNIFLLHGKAAPPSKYDDFVRNCFLIAEKEIVAERDRLQLDETAAKKDTIAGAQVIDVVLGPLSKPIDPPSCIPFAEIQIGRAHV